MLQQEYASISNKIKELEEKREYYEHKLKYNLDEDDEIECKYQIMKIQEELRTLRREQNNIMRDLEKGQKKEEANKKTYKKYYVTLDKNMLLNLKKYFKVAGSSKDEILKSIINKYPQGNAEEIINTAIININNFDDDYIDEVLDVINDEGGYLENTNVDPYRNKDSIYNKLGDETRACVMYIVKNYDLIFLGINTHNHPFEFEFLDWKTQHLDEEDYYDGIDYDNNIHPMKYDIKRDDHIPDNFIFTILTWDFVDMDVLKKFSIPEKFTEYKIQQEIEHIKWLKKNKERLEKLEKERKEEEREIKEKQERMEKLQKDLKKKREEKNIPECYTKLNEDSTIEEIANCYCKCKDFNNWELDEKNKKIIFKLLRADGNNFSKMKKIEIKKLKKWVNDYEINLI